MRSAITTAIAANASAAQISTTLVDITGKWAINIGTPSAPEFRTLDAVMSSDGRLAGVLGSPNGAVPITTGRVTGARFVLSATLGTGLRLDYDGVVSHDTIRGTWRYDNSQGAFIGRRGDVPPRAEAVLVTRVPGTSAVDRAARNATIDSMAQAIANRYVDTALAPRVIAGIRERASAGAYDTLTTVAAFGRGVTQDLRRFDKHFSLFPATSTGQPQMPGAARDNFGIKRIERLDGNVGYLRFDIFSLDSSGAASVLRSALRALARTDALILDLRQNGGGNGALGQMLFSTFVPGPARATADMFTRTTSGFDSTAIMTAARIEPDTRYDERPIYLLTSARTASAAEWLAYNLQSVGRAKIVGEVTAGAAHPIRFVRLNDMFDAAIPIGRVRSRITKTDFEGVGVQPDIAVPVDRAFSTAYRELLGRLLAQTSDPVMKAEIERAVADAKPDRDVDRTPATPDRGRG
jgi:hypothetical protein